MTLLRLGTVSKQVRFQNQSTTLLKKYLTNRGGAAVLDTKDVKDVAAGLQIWGHVNEKYYTKMHSGQKKFQQIVIV